LRTHDGAVTTHLDQKPSPLGSRLRCFTLLSFVLWLVIIILGEEGVGHSPFIRSESSCHESHVGHVLAMAIHSAYIYE